MFLFITSIRHPINCHSYDRVGRLLEYTLQSICNQLHDSFKVLVVCNKIPNIRINQNIEYLEVDFPAPSDLHQPQTGIEAIRIDRGCKYMAGLIHARRYDPSYVMFFDADDCISRKIVEHVQNQEEKCGWYIEKGFRYRSGDTHLSLQSDFHQHCGTSLIYPYTMLRIPPELSENATISNIQACTDDKYLKHILGSHRVAVSLHQAQGLEFKPLPFHGAIWILDHGENHSGKKGVAGDIPISEEIRNEFFFDPDRIKNIV